MKKYEFHPLAQAYRRMSAHDLGRMEEGMRENGFDERFPIVLYQGKILDGCNRYVCAEAAEVKPVFVTFKGSAEAAEAFVRLANEERRHLTEAELTDKRQERLKRVAEKREEGKSLRAISEDEGVSVSQVKRDLEDAEQDQSQITQIPTNCTGGGTVEVPKTQGKVQPLDGKVTGKDGRTRTATPAKPKTLCERCTRVGAVQDCEACKEARKKPPKAGKKVTGETSVKGDADEGEMERFKDAEGTDVPNEAVPAFQAAKDIEAKCREIDGIIKAIEDISKGPGGRLIRFEAFKQSMKDAKGNLWANRPTHVCPYCHGKAKAKPCECCGGAGWTAKHIYQQAPGVKK